MDFPLLFLLHAGMTAVTFPSCALFLFFWVIMVPPLYTFKVRVTVSYLSLTGTRFIFLFYRRRLDCCDKIWWPSAFMLLNSPRVVAVNDSILDPTTSGRRTITTHYTSNRSQWWTSLLYRFSASVILQFMIRISKYEDVLQAEWSGM